MSSKKDKFYLKLALNLAKQHEGLTRENPSVGCVIVKNNKILSLSKTSINGRPHAEVNAIRLANTNDLKDSTIYVTLEPCSMCASALVHARISRIIYGTSDKIAGACGSVFDLVNNKNLNHSIEVHSGILEDDCRKILKDFFRARR